MEKTDVRGKENYVRKAREEFKNQRTLCGQACLNKYLLSERNVNVLFIKQVLIK